MSKSAPFDYDQAAHVYDRHRRGGGPYTAALLGLANASGASRVLEVGAGTGNNTQPFVEAHPCSLTALELSAGMLAKACAKPISAHWVRGDATAIPFAADAFDFIFGVYMLHHIDRLEAFASECVRVLERGAAAFVTAPHGFIERHPMNAYFPSFAAVDKARFHAVEAVEEVLRGTGFAETGTIPMKAAPKPIDADYLARVENKFISTYALLPAGEFEAGLERLRADIAAKGQLDVPIVWEAATVWGRMPG